MATTKPTSSTFWTTVSTYLDTISSGLRDSGFIPNTLIAGGEVNTLFKDAFDWIDFFRSGGGSVAFPPGSLSWDPAPSGLVVTRPSPLSFNVNLAYTGTSATAYGLSSPINAPGTVVDAVFTPDNITDRKSVV